MYSVPKTRRGTEVQVCTYLPVYIMHSALHTKWGTEVHVFKYLMNKAKREIQMFIICPLVVLFISYDNIKYC